MPIYSAVDETHDLWCLVFTGKVRMPDMVGCLEACLSAPQLYRQVDALIDARGAEGFDVATDEEMDEVVRLARTLRKDSRYGTAYLTRTAEMRVNVDVFLQMVGSKRARRQAFAEIPEALSWLGRSGAERDVAAFLAEMQGRGRARRWAGIGW